MKSLSSRPFSPSQMTRRALSIAATAAALFVSNNALADEAPSAETVEQPKSEISATPASEPAPAAPVAEAAPAVEPAPATVEPAPLVLAPPPAPAPAPVAAPPSVVQAPRFAPVTMGQQDKPAAAASETESKDQSFRIGAMVGVGFPRPFAAEGFIKIKEYVGVGFEYSFMPNATFAGTDITFHGIAADLRVFPMKGGFFVGVRGGKQWLRTSTTIDASINGVPNVGGKYNESMSAETMFVNPRIGYLKTFDSGITIGIDAGVQIPINPSYTRASDAANDGISSKDADKTLLAVANTLGNKVTPSVDLLRIGFLF